MIDQPDAQPYVAETTIALAPMAVVDAAEEATPELAVEPAPATDASSPGPQPTSLDVPPDAPPKPPELSPAACGARLAVLFPALFIGPDGQGTWKAIKLRIHADIQARAPGVFSKRTLGIFFSRYTTTTAYLKALAAPDTQRFDLDGQPAGEIAEEHRAAAVEELARRREMQDARRAAEREAHRQARVQTRPRDAQPVPAPGDAPQGTPPPRPQRFAQGPRPARPPRSSQPTPQPRQAKQRAAAATAEPVVPAPASPDDAARRERALLWRAFESSTLTKANFCVLKRIDAVTLDAALAQARKEQAERGFAEPAQPAHEHRLGPRRG